MWRPQGSILRPLLFNIGTCDMFLLNSSFDIASYASDNRPYISIPTLDLVKTELEICCTDLLVLFGDNRIKSNPNKCHHQVIYVIPPNLTLTTISFITAQRKKLYGVKIDSQFLFNSHVSTLYKKASQKLHVLLRITNYMGL